MGHCLLALLTIAIQSVFSFFFRAIFLLFALLVTVISSLIRYPRTSTPVTKQDDKGDLLIAFEDRNLGTPVAGVRVEVTEELAMGARQSKRSVDISSTPKKDAEGGQVTEKLEKIEEGDVKVQNGHAEPVTQEGEDGSKSPAEAASPVVNGETTAESSESGATSPASPQPAGEEAKEEPATPDQKEEGKEDKTKSEDKSEKKKKEKSKKKWSFRSISFSKKDKTKPAVSKDDSKGDLAKEAPLAEEAPAKSEEVSSPTSDGEATVKTPETEEASKESTPATAEPPKEEAKKEEPAAPAPVVDIKSVVTSVAESGVQKVVEETTKIVNEAKEAVNTVVETATKTVVEEIKSSTTISESASIIKTCTKTIEIVEEAVAPPLPASPPPTEAPPPTPVAPQQHEHEEINGGGEGMAEMPEENGLDHEKLDDEPEHEQPKMNGHSESPVKQVEEITECLMKTSIEDKHVVDNHLEVAVGGENKD